MINTHSNMMLPQEAKNGPFQGQQGEGVALPFSRLWCLGLFTTEILRDFSGEDGALKSPKGEGHPLSLLSLKGTLFGLLREHHVRVCIDHVLAVFHAYYAMI